MDPSEDSDLNAEPDSHNNSKLKIILVISSIILIGELIYFTQFSGIKIPIKLPTPSFTSLIVFVESLKKTLPKLTIKSTKYITPTLIKNPTQSPNNKNVEYVGKIILFDNSINSSGEEELYFNIEYNLERNIKIIKTFFYNKSELSTIKVINYNGKIISYKDLKVGDNVKIIQDLESVNSPNTKVEIHILK